MKPDTSELKACRRFLQILYFTLFATVGMYWLVLEMLAPGPEPHDVEAIKLPLQVVAGGTALGVLYLRFVRVAPLLAGSATHMNQLVPRLRFYYILCYTLSEAVALYGFVLRLLGASREEVVAFFVGSGLLFLLCYPRLPESPSGSG